MTQTSRGHEAHRARLLRRPRHLVLRALARGDPRPPGRDRDRGHRRHRRRGRGRRSRSARARSAPSRTTSIDARRAYFDQVLRFLIMGNVRRGGLYPLCVGAERVLQAQTVAQWARKLGTDVGRARLHRRRQRPGALRGGAAHAGARARDPRAGARPARSSARSSSSTCEARKLPVPPYGAAYSVNRGLWGVTIGGRETLDLRRQHPGVGLGADSRTPSTNPQPPERHTIGFEAGVPCSLDGEALDPVTLIERARSHRRQFGIGRGIHLGDTIIGIKGRVAFEAPAAEVLLTAHRELEKLVLTRAPAAHEGHARRALRRPGPRGPAPRSRCAATSRRCSLSSQQRVTGEVHVLLRPG